MNAELSEALNKMNQENNQSNHWNNKWCEDCQHSYMIGCPDHQLVQVIDRPIPPRAFTTLPRCLVISKIQRRSMTTVERSRECNKKKRKKTTSGIGGRQVKEKVVQNDGNGVDDDEISGFNGCFYNASESSVFGVFARGKILPRTQFGPVVSDVKERLDVGRQPFHLLLDRHDRTCRLDLSDVRSCNWMMFVRPATSSTNQNLAAFQHDQSIFYVSTKVIEEGQELRVWYARPYAERLGRSMLQDAAKDFLANDDDDDDDDDGSSPFNQPKTLTAETISEETSTEGGPVKSGKEFRTNKRKMRLVEKKKKDDDDDDVKFEEEQDNIGSDDHDDDDYYYPKKIWTGLRKCKRQIKRLTLRSAPSKTKVPPANHRSTSIDHCQQCNLFFDNPSLLKLHGLVHRGDDPPRDLNGAEIPQPSGGLNKEPIDNLSPPFNCPACNQNFETGSALSSHVDQHASAVKSPSRPFMCQLCHKNFANFERLQQHLLCHGDESLKPLACGVCSRRFMNPAALSVHMKTHGDRKYYTCPLCPESFDQVQQLRSHAEERHLERTMRVFEHTEGNTEKDNSRDMQTDARETSHGEGDFTGDSSCAAVAIATATTAIASGIWIGSMDDSCRKVSNMATDGEMEFMSDVVGHCLFAEEVTTDEQTNGVLLEEANECEKPMEGGGNSATKNPSYRAEGTYHCPECHRVFAEFSAVSRHVRLFHSSRSFECKECGRVFPRMDKLRLHSLRHSNHREFVCETCGRQFKRKDKLRDHIRRQHDSNKEKAKRKNSSVSSFTPEISPLDFTKFVFKCQKCLLGFKRRGMLVNHMANKHPDIPMTSIPELNLPILTSRHDFFCQYCHKVFKSNSKRKFHILKHHPGSELPASLRPKRSDNATSAKESKEALSRPRSTSSFSTPNGHLASQPYSCSMCHRQYCSKSKLFQHQRKKHSALNGATLGTNDATAELEDATRTLQVPVIDVPMATTLPEMDYGELFMGASIYFTPKGAGGIERENNMASATAARSVLVLSNEDELLTHGSSQLSFGKTQNFVTAAQAQVEYPKPQQTVIIDPDVFAQAMNELTKSYAAKNSIILTHFETQNQFPQNGGGHSDVISLTVENGVRFAGQPSEGAQLIQVTPSAGAIMSSPYISVVEYESLCSASDQMH